MHELKSKRIWLVWNYEIVNGRKTKVPMDPHGHGRSGSSKKFAHTWMSFEKAAEARERLKMDGIGFVIPEGYGVVDIDHMMDEMPEPVKSAFELFQSYCEKSPSGQGVHIIFRVDKSKIPVVDGGFDNKTYYMKNSKTGVEIYLGGFTNRYMTFTGNVLKELPVIDCTEGYLQYLEQFMRKEPVESNRSKARSNMEKSNNSIKLKH